MEQPKHPLDNLLIFDGSMPQNTPDWERARLGRITASDRAQRIMSDRPSTLNTVLKELRHELTTLTPYREFKGNRHTAHGHRFEEQAYNEYIFASLELVDREYAPGMFVHPECPILSATPDFFEGDNISGQIKCPSKSGNHLRMYHHGLTDPGYISQVNCEALVTGRTEIVFISYDPRVAPMQQLWVKKMDYDEKRGALMLERAQEIYQHLIDGTSYGEGTLSVERGVPSLF